MGRGGVQGFLWHGLVDQEKAKNVMEEEQLGDKGMQGRVVSGSGCRGTCFPHGMA